MASRIFLLGLNVQGKPITIDDASEYLERLLDDFDEAAQDEGIYIRAPGESPFNKSAEQFSDILMGERPNQFYPDMLLEKEGIEKLVRYDFHENGNILYVIPTSAVLDFANAITDRAGISKGQVPESVNDRELLFIDTYGNGKISKY